MSSDRFLPAPYPVNRLKYRFIFGLAVGLLGAAGCGSREEPPAVAEPAREPPKHQVVALTGGTLGEWLAQPGETIRRGQAVARLDIADAAEQLRLAQRAYAEADSALIDIRREYLRQKRAHETGELDEAAWQEALATFRAAEQARADAAQAMAREQNRLMRHDVISRADGILSAWQAEPGATVASGQVIAVVMPTDRP